MQRSYPLRFLALGLGLLGTQCLDSLSDDCNETLTCENEPTPRLNALCQWVDEQNRPWPGPSPARYDSATGLWTLPDGRQSMTPDFGCRPGAGLDAGADASGPSCDADRPCDVPFICNEGTCVECVESEHCASRGPVGDAGVAPVCDAARNECVACLEHDDCSGETPFCKTDANSDLNECVECTQDSQCSPDSPVCDQRTNECTTRCTSAEQCGGNKPVCNVAEQLCVECTSNETCSAPTPQCNTTTNDCVECVDDAPCSGADEVCDTATNLCVQCREDLQCADSEIGARCNLETKLCVQCLNDAQCGDPTQSRCNLGTNQCVGCDSSDQCEGGFLCNVTTRTCVQCLSDDQCTDPFASQCETTTGRCVECLDSDACLLFDAARCELAPGANLYSCQGCTENGDCAGKDFPGQLCDTTLSGGLCVGCRNQGDCADPALSQCERTGVAPGSTCARCEVDTHCTQFEDRRVCDPAQGCVECISDNDCADPEASQCVGNQCVPCIDNTDCAHLAPALGVCDTRGGAGRCVQCTGPDRAACGSDVCNSANRTCELGVTVGSADLCESCVSDAHCESGQRCATQRFGAQDLGTFCLPVSGEAGSCELTPYSEATATTTIDGEAATLCTLRRTTCAGLVDFNEQTCTIDADCGDDRFDDGRCGGAVCSIPCTTSIDCFDPSSNSCLGGICQL